MKAMIATVTRCFCANPTGNGAGAKRCRMLDRVRSHRTDVLRLARENKAESVMVFGSCARGEERADSDIDFLVTFEDGASLLNQVHMRDGLQELFGVAVDVVSRRGLSPYIGKHILAEAVPV